MEKKKKKKKKKNDQEKENVYLKNIFIKFSVSTVNTCRLYARDA
jgi:hypothetical protein